jgi:hypothetical protein
MNKELQDIKTLVRFVQGLEQEIAQEEASLKEKKARLDFFKLDAIPEYILSLGLSEVKLDSGERITVKTNYFGNISEERREAAHKWLREHQSGSLIKQGVDLMFTDSTEHQLDQALLINFLKENSIEYKKSETVHPQSLKSFIREQMEAGNNFPYELFGVYVAKELRVETPKTK